MFEHTGSTSACGLRAVYRADGRLIVRGTRLSRGGLTGRMRGHALGRWAPPWAAPRSLAYLVHLSHHAEPPAWIVLPVTHPRPHDYTVTWNRAQEGITGGGACRIPPRPLSARQRGSERRDVGREWCDRTCAQMPRRTHRAGPFRCWGNTIILTDACCSDCARRGGVREICGVSEGRSCVLLGATSGHLWQGRPTK
jgi:hypothetical protein